MSEREQARFYRELTRRNRGFIPDRTQQALRSARVLVAGCGSTGGAAVEPLARLGVQHFALADNGAYELNNLNRQHAYQHEIGRNKARVTASRVLGVNPHAEVAVHEDGIQESNVDVLVAEVDLVVDGVDVTGRAGWEAKVLLHEAAARHRKPVITGYDMAGAQYVRCYDYRRRPRPALDGRVSRSDVAERSTWMLLHRVVPTRFVPVEMLADARAHLGEPDYSVPQLVYASLLFGAIASRMAVDLLTGRRVRKHVLVDVHRQVRPRAAVLLGLGRKPAVAAAALADLARRERRPAAVPEAALPEVAP